MSYTNEVDGTCLHLAYVLVESLGKEKRILSDDLLHFVALLLNEHFAVFFVEVFELELLLQRHWLFVMQLVSDDAFSTFTRHVMLARNHHCVEVTFLNQLRLDPICKGATVNEEVEQHAEDVVLVLLLLQ